MGLGAGGGAPSEARRFELADGRLLELRVTPQFGRGRRVGSVLSFRDVTDLVRQQEALKLAAKVFEASHDAIVIAEASGKIVAVNPSGVNLTGVSHPASRDMALRELLMDPEAGDFWPQVDARLGRDGRWSGEVWHRRADGGVTPVRLLVVRMMDLAGTGWHDVCFLRDLSERMADKRRIEELVLSDSLTGLPNRLLLARRFEQAMQGADAVAGSGFSVLFIDLDRFKHINDSMGHLFGDRVLLQVAQRLGRGLRPGDTLARLGGDEFVVLLAGCTGTSAEVTAHQILADLSQPFEVDGLRFTLTASIGIARYPDDGRSTDDLIKHADTAMYAVKELGRSGVRFYCASMNADLLSRVKLDHAMREALEKGAFRLVYQPQVPVAGLQWVGVEALIRWTDPELGEVSPGQFIPVAEETGFIVEIGNWVLDEAAKQAARWRASGLSVPVAVNVSALQFQQSDFVSRVSAALARNGLPGQGLELELTESILVKDAEDALDKLHRLAQMGIRLSVDDFGTGYSSLAYLKRFPIHKLKIDRSFVNGLPRDESDAAIVKAIVEMGHAMKLKVIAEGVEREEQRAALYALGCDEYQGFLFARPASPDLLQGSWMAPPPSSTEAARQ
ncbi:MAG: EAL domain-containing protein [Gammaproteobacteria bacterium]|nr:MAG: EAL domain-containing protein [Gammaproteobacteria bacterium]